MAMVGRLSGALLFAVLVSASGPLWAQDVELLYDKGGVFSGEKYVSISHADAEGTIPPDTSVVRSSERLYFAVRPTGDWTFEINDKQALRSISPVQEGSILRIERVTLIDGDEGTRMAVIEMPKSQVDWMTPIKFRHAVDTTAGLPLKEQYASGYESLHRAYREGQRLLDEGTPLRAIEALRPFCDPVEPQFSFVAEARSVLDSASTQVLDRARSRFRALREDLVSKPNANGLARLDSFRVRLDSMRAVLEAYAEARFDRRTDVQTRVESLTRSADELYANVRSTYRQETLRIFMRGTYEDPKLRLYLHGLTQLLLAPGTAVEASEVRVDSLRPAVLSTPRFTDLRQQLRAEEWEKEFREIIRLVNENIYERQEVFGAEIMESLRLRRPAAPHPYYEIFAAMNAKLKEDTARFTEAWARALEKVTALSFLNHLQRWRLASQASPRTVSKRARSLAKEARSFRRDGDLKAAEDRLQLAARLAEPYAPLYYELGALKQAQGDTLRAREDFERAQALADSYAPPEVEMLRQLLAQEKYERTLARADSLLQEQSYWLLYLPKARALLGMKQYDEARRVLRGRCEPLNDESHALYTLLAEAYVGMDAWKGVRWAVQQTEALTPRRSPLEQRLSEVRSAARERGISLTTAAGDSMSTDELREHADTTRGIETVGGSEQ